MNPHFSYHKQSPVEALPFSNIFCLLSNNGIKYLFKSFWICFFFMSNYFENYLLFGLILVLWIILILLSNSEIINHKSFEMNCMAVIGKAIYNDSYKRLLSLEMV